MCGVKAIFGKLDETKQSHHWNKSEDTVITYEKDRGRLLFSFILEVTRSLMLLQWRLPRL